MSLLVQTTVVPALTVSIAGSKAKLVMLTFASAAAGTSPPAATGGAAWGVELGGATFADPVEYFVEAPLGEQAAMPSPAAIVNAATRGRVNLDLHDVTRPKTFTLIALVSLWGAVF